MSRIGSVVKENENTVYVYDEEGHYLFHIHARKLIGYTSSTVTVEDDRGFSIVTYNANGECKSSKPIAQW